MGARLKELAGLVGQAVYGLVFTAILGIASAAEWARGSHVSALIIGAAAVLVLLAATGWVAYQALKQRDEALHAEEEAKGVHHHYNAPVTIVQGQQGSLPPTPRETVGPHVAPTEKPIISLHEFVEFPNDGPPVIRNRTFRNSVLRGPIWLHGIRSSMTNTVLGVAEQDPWSILWPLEPGTLKIGIVVFENCVAENCVTEHVGLVGTREELEEIIRQVGDLQFDGSSS